MSDNYYNLSPEEKKKQNDDMYQKFIVLGIVPLFIYLMWPLIFGTNELEVPAAVIEDRVEEIDERIDERPDIDETSFEPENTNITPVTPTTSKRTAPNKIQPGTIKKQPIQRNNNETFTLSYNAGDKIEYITQGAGWKGTVTSNQGGNYTVRLTEIITANAQQQYLPGNNPCFGGKPIGKNAVNQIISVPGRCIHDK